MYYNCAIVIAKRKTKLKLPFRYSVHLPLWACKNWFWFPWLFPIFRHFSLTSFQFPDLSRFSRVVTLILNIHTLAWQIFVMSLVIYHCGLDVYVIPWLLQLPTMPPEANDTVHKLHKKPAPVSDWHTLHLDMCHVLQMPVGVFRVCLTSLLSRLPMLAPKKITDALPVARLSLGDENY